jgi:hypothetical protein
VERKCTVKDCPNESKHYWGEDKHYCVEHSKAERDRLINLAKSRVKTIDKS